ncbi:helix-turn-helix transcriptional regulator [Ferrimicrobium sp.]|uniref:helix-turn-helix transcriptional regulator n=1 Tax=Ferrimicrobium sp. TaxID=2926050 RepID=UPI00262DBF86|nr:helix-turn-helix transcriptional regulator [Ferrimicrobium sp.]
MQILTSIDEILESSFHAQLAPDARFTLDPAAREQRKRDREKRGERQDAPPSQEWGAIYGASLRFARLALDVSSRHLASELGISLVMLSTWETCYQSSPTYGYLVSLDELLGTRFHEHFLPDVPICSTQAAYEEATEFYQRFNENVWNRDKGQVIRREREAYGYSVLKLSGILGCSYAWLVEVENATAKPSLRFLRSIDQLPGSDFSHQYYLDDWTLKLKDLFVDRQRPAQRDSSNYHNKPLRKKAKQPCWTARHATSLKHARIKIGMQVNTVAKRCGVGSYTIWTWERCAAHPTYQQMKVLDTLLGSNLRSDFKPSSRIAIKRGDQLVVTDFYQRHYPRIAWSESLGESLRRPREERGMSLRQLAKVTRFSVAALARAEKGVTTPRLALLLALDRVFGTSYADTLFFDRWIDIDTGALLEAKSTESL